MRYLNLKEWEEAFKKDKKAVILDVRSQEEYDLEHIPGAKLVNVQNPQKFMDEIEQLDKDHTYFVYCRTGNRSAQACQVLDFNGFKNIFGLEGGFERWKSEHIEN